ncbi:DVUA0089 family protein [Merismopedia glauca]|uniref:PEP-CTERM sorting domain-containing protein n=1 Tax=Merismopedia glauca CCAP 1448/3 TaxID=1296344 RepID=A0A2T1C137_9CYAN|nr:DVUA0089 family protein [Merismopedia glauca]PSB01914.1 hypothetical protein C7B64_15750 [Merismopedia glauca CCAP 1448/3]
MLLGKIRKNFPTQSNLLYSAKVSSTLAGLALITLSIGLTNPASAANLSFRGNFTQDDDVRLINFTLSSTSQVIIKSLSYAGGTQADGTLVSAGGFDPILSLFDNGGNLIDSNDDGGSSHVPADLTTGAGFDAFLTSLLNPGTYTVAVTQFYNFPGGTNISQGFRHQGEANFTSLYGCSTGVFCDTTGNSRTNFWAVDVLKRDEPIPPTSVPEPSTLLGAFLALSTLSKVSLRKKRIKE